MFIYRVNPRSIQKLRTCSNAAITRTFGDPSRTSSSEIHRRSRADGPCKQSE